MFVFNPHWILDIVNDYNCSRQSRQDPDPESDAIDGTASVERLSEQIRTSPKAIILVGLYSRMVFYLVCSFLSCSIFYVLIMVLLDYHHQDDKNIASRGSISMKTAILQVGEWNQFKVHSIPSRRQHHHHHHTGVHKWYMKANHPVEAHRWTEAISKSIEWLKLHKLSAATNSNASSLTPSFMSKCRRSGESDSSALKLTPLMQSHSLSGHMGRKSAPGESTRDRDSMTGSSYTFLDLVDGSPNLTQNEEGGPPVESLNSAENDTGNEGDDDSSSAPEPCHHSVPIEGK